MKRLAVFSVSLVLLSTLAVPADQPKVKVFDFTRLTPGEATGLQGKVVRCKAQLVVGDDESAECDTVDSGLRCIIWRKGEAVEEEGGYVGEGGVKLMKWDGYELNGETVEGFWQFRLEEAAVVRQ